MNRRRIIPVLILILIVIVGLSYIRISLRRAALPPKPSKMPVLSNTPARLYGLIEPKGREIFVASLSSRRVMEIFVVEGQSVKAGDMLCRLDDDVERQAVKIAEARVEQSRRQIAKVRDEYECKKRLSLVRAAPELEVSQLELQLLVEEQIMDTLRTELEMRRIEAEKLTLRAPSDGIVYTFDVRMGEQLQPEDYRRIVIGQKDKQVRLFVETFWRDRVKVGDRFSVLDRETLRKLGNGIVEQVAPYAGVRDFRSEDSLERLDTKFIQAIVKLEDPAMDIPIGLMVMCERENASEPSAD